MKNKHLQRAADDARSKTGDIIADLIAEIEQLENDLDNKESDLLAAESQIHDLELQIEEMKMENTLAKHSNQEEKINLVHKKLRGY